MIEVVEHSSLWVQSAIGSLSLPLEGGVRGVGRWEGGGGSIFIESPRRGGVFRGGGGAEGPGGCLRRIGEFFWGGGGLNIFSEPNLKRTPHKRFSKMNSLHSGAKKHINIKKRTEHRPYRTPPRNSLCGPLLLENKGEGGTHIKNLGLHWGPFILYVGISLCAFFAPLFTPRIWRAHFLPNPTLQSCSLAEP